MINAIVDSNFVLESVQVYYWWRIPNSSEPWIFLSCSWNQICLPSCYDRFMQVTLYSAFMILSHFFLVCHWIESLIEYTFEVFKSFQSCKSLQPHRIHRRPWLKPFIMHMLFLKHAFIIIWSEPPCVHNNMSNIMNNMFSSYDSTPLRFH